jgi:hypothetical protein
MLSFFGRIGQTGRKARARRVTHVRLNLEGLEERELLTAPLPPTGVIASGISSSQIALNWNASTDPSVTVYDVFAKIWVVAGGGKGSRSGHWVYQSVGSNLTAHNETIGGLGSGTYHTYVVTAVNSSGHSLYSLPATAETWIAPSLPYGPNTVLLSDGALWSSPVSATAGMTTQITLLGIGNPLSYSVVSGPSSVSINSKHGVVTFTPTASEVGTVNVKFKVSNALGSASQTIQFDVAAYPNLTIPTLKLGATSSTYNGQYQTVSATAVGSNGVTPLAGSYSYAYNGGAFGAPLNAGTYQVLVTFTSSDPSYGNATLLANFAIKKATPTFSYLAAPTIAAGTATTLLSGFVSAGTVVPNGEYVIVTVHGVSEATLVDHNGYFAVSFNTSALAASNYTITYAYAGDANLKAAANASSILRVIPTVPPKVTVNPVDETVSVGDPAIFTANVTGVPTPTVQWQVSTDGGATFTNITGNTSALTTTLIFVVNSNQNGYKYRAVFTNSLGTATTTAATLTVDGDD